MGAINSPEEQHLDGCRRLLWELRAGTLRQHRMVTNTRGGGELLLPRILGISVQCSHLHDENKPIKFIEKKFSGRRSKILDSFELI